MKKANVAIAMIAVFAAVSCAKAEAGTMKNLSGAGDKIASVDMKKDFSQAGDILDGFFSGSAAKKGLPVETSVNGNDAAKAGTAAANIYGQTAKELCNAQPAKTGKLNSAVKPLAGAAAGMQKGTSWIDDAVTVGEYLVDVVPDAAQVAVDVVQGDVIGLIDSVPDLYNSATCKD